MLRILLVGDVAIKADAPYHVGDEASLNEVARRIRQELPRAEVTLFRGMVPPIEISQRWLDILGCGELPSPLLDELQGHDLIWLVGSGNLNSMFRAYIYHRAALSLAAQRLGIHMVFSSQTIGPLDECDRNVLALGLHAAHYVSVRDRADSLIELERLCVECAITPDDASALPARELPANSSCNVGVSLRDWDAPEVAARVRDILSLCPPDTRVHLIPHLIDKSDSLDIRAMSKAIPGRAYRYRDLLSMNLRLDVAVKSLTAAMNVVIATRYHGAVFAATARVPCIALYSDEYYRRKMQGLVSLNYDGVLAMDVRQAFVPDQVRQALHAESTSVQLSLPSCSEIVGDA